MKLAKNGVLDKVPGPRLNAVFVSSMHVLDNRSFRSFHLGNVPYQAPNSAIVSFDDDVTSTKTKE